MHALSDYETCCEGSLPARGYGMGKGPMTAHGAPAKKYGMGKGLMIQNSVPKNGIGKGLMMIGRGANTHARGFKYDACSSGSVIQKKKKRVQPRESILVCSPVLCFSYLNKLYIFSCTSIYRLMNATVSSNSLI